MRRSMCSRPAARPSRWHPDPERQHEAFCFSMDETQRMRNIVEAALLTAGEPVAIGTLAKLFDPALDTMTVQQLLAEIAADWAGKSVELVQVASGWRFQCKPDVQSHLDRLTPEKPPRYSRAVMETLA